MGDYKQVVVPKGFWFRMATREYYNWQNALMREFIQNSYDAGSKHIEFKLVNNKLYIKDNGSGMTLYTIENSLLTLGGSHKDEGSVGGIGKAKELLYFSWPSWGIRTKNNIIQGIEGTFKITQSCNYIHGTESFINLEGKTIDPKKSLTQYLNYCALPIKISFNGILIKQSLHITYGTKIYEIDGLGDLYENKAISGSLGVHVLVNGLYMFTVSSVLDKSYIFNITKKSYECLTANRDGFTGEWQDKFSRMVGKVAIDSESTNLKREKIIIVNQLNRDESTVKILNQVKNSQLGDAISSYLNIPTDKIKLDDVIEYMNGSFPSIETLIDDSTKQVVQTLIKSEYQSKAFNQCLTWYKKSFPEGFIIVSELDLDTGTRYNLFLRDYMKLSILWRHIINFILNDVIKLKDIKIGFGIIESERVEAQYRNGYFLLNPFMWDDMEWNDFFIKIYMLACHEIVHYLKCSVHNETFIMKFETILFETLCNRESDKDLIAIITKVKK